MKYIKNEIGLWLRGRSGSKQHTGGRSYLCYCPSSVRQLEKASQNIFSQVQMNQVETRPYSSQNCNSSSFSLSDVSNMMGMKK